MEQGQMIAPQVSDLDARQIAGSVSGPTSSDVARTGSTNGEVAGPAVRISSLSWDEFTAANWSAFTALNWSRFTSYSTQYIAGLLRIVSELRVAGSTAGEVVLDDAIGQLQTLTPEGQITHD